MSKLKLVNETLVPRPGVMVCLRQLPAERNDPFESYVIDQYFNHNERIDRASMLFRRETLIAFRDILNKVFPKVTK